MNDRDDRTNAHPHGGPAPPALIILTDCRFTVVEPLRDAPAHSILSRARSKGRLRIRRSVAGGGNGRTQTRDSHGCRVGRLI